MEGASHPNRDQLERFMRAGGLPKPEVRAVVRHLLTGCPRCIAVTRRLWSFGERQRALESLLEEAQAFVQRQRHSRASLY